MDIVDNLDFTGFDLPDDSAAGRWQVLPAVLQAFSYGPGESRLVVVAEQRLYLDDVSKWDDGQL